MRFGSIRHIHFSTWKLGISFDVSSGISLAHLSKIVISSRLIYGYIMYIYIYMYMYTYHEQQRGKLI